MANVRLNHVDKFFGTVQAVKDVSLNVEDKEFVVLVGPSGCGKSTTLRMIAGLEEISSGEIFIGDKKVNDLPPKDRDIAMVFQSYALYPHLSVFENMAFGLRLRKMPKAEIESRVKEAAEILGLMDLLDRKPRALSGGQRQRVAMGRAIVRRPAVFLFDEPLSNLDAKLRVQMRTEIARLHHRLGSTSIYVTHDQVEAMTLADRIVVMKDGEVQQVGSPMELYHRPANLFVATFIGSPAMNLIAGQLIREKDDFFLKSEHFSIPLPEKWNPILHKNSSDELVLGIRPQHLFIAENKDEKTVATMMLEVTEPLGSETFLYFQFGEKPFVVREQGSERRALGEHYHLQIDAEALILFDKKTQKALQ